MLPRLFLVTYLLGSALDRGDAVGLGLLIQSQSVSICFAFFGRRYFDRLASRFHRAGKVAGTGLGSGERIIVERVLFAAPFDSGLGPLDGKLGVANRIVGTSGQQPCRAAVGLAQTRIDFDGPFVLCFSFAVA